MSISVLPTLVSIANVILVPALLGAAWVGIDVLKRHGYQTTYAEAIVRAMGAGVMAAQDRGVNPFTGAGRGIVAAVGTKYLVDHVSDAAEGLGIEPDQHAERVIAQLGVVKAQAEALLGPTEVTSH